MASIISALVNASTSIAFKAAVDALPRNEEYYTAEIRDQILQKQNLIVDAQTADAAVSFLMEFSRDDSTCTLLRTAEVRDLIIDVLAPKISAGDPVENLGSAICNIVQNESAAELYANRKSLSAILDCFHRATTSGSARWIAGSINNISAFHPDAKNILNDLPVVEAFSAIIPHATTNDCAQWIYYSIVQIVKDNEPAQKLFGTLSFLATLRASENSTPSADAQFWLTKLEGLLLLQSSCTSFELKAAIDAIREEKHYTVEILGAILQKQNLIVDAPTADAVVSFLFGIVASKRDLLRTAVVRDLIIDVLAPTISEGDSVGKLGITISNLACNNETAAKLYANRKSFAAILDCFHRATTAGSAKAIASSINNICCMNPGANKLLNDLPVIEAFSAIIPLATTDDSVRWISNCIDKILDDNEPAEQLFGTPSFLEKFKSMEKYVTDPTNSTIYIMNLLQHIVTQTCITVELKVETISREEQHNIVEFCSLSRRLRQQNLIIDAPTVDSVVSLLQSLRGDLLRTAEIRRLIIDVLVPKIGAGDSIEKLGRMICRIVQNAPAAELYSNRKSFSAILDCFHRATTTGSARWIASSINNICAYNSGANKILNDLPVVEAFSAIIPHATTNDCAQWISCCMAEILKDNETAQKLVGTPTFLEKFKTMEKYVTSDDAKTAVKDMIGTLQAIMDYPTRVQSLRRASTSTELKAAVDALPRSRIFYTAEVLDLIREKQNLVVDASSADAVVSFLEEFKLYLVRFKTVNSSEVE